MTCPNRDGTLGNNGCIFCSEGGSGEFAAKRDNNMQLQIESAKRQVQSKITAGKFIAYFQSYTNTYAPVDYLKELFTKAIEHPDIAVLSIATRPDCLSDEIIELLKHLNQIKPVWIELGLQTIHEDTAALIHRGYSLPLYDSAVRRLNNANIAVITHIILGLPGEDHRKNYQTINYLNHQNIQGIKLHLLHILQNTELAKMFQREPFMIPSLDQYAELLVGCIARLSPDIVIHRITGDGAKDLLLAPQWSLNKKKVLNTIHKRFRERDLYQGRLLNR